MTFDEWEEKWGDLLQLDDANLREIYEDAYEEGVFDMKGTRNDF